MITRYVILMVLLIPAMAYGQLGGLGVFGDSLSDEYFDDPARNYAKNWVQQSVLYRGVNLGPTAAAALQPGGTWGEPRRTGYETNWARSGANSLDVLNGLTTYGSTITAQINAGKITHAVVAIGANDFAPGTSAWTGLYNNTYNTTQIQTLHNQVVNNIIGIVNNLKGQGVKVVLANVPDYSVAAATRSGYPDPLKRQNITDVVTGINVDLKSFAQAQQLPYIDFQGSADLLLGSNLSPRATITIGGNVISTTSFGTAPTNAFVADGVHLHSLMQSFLADIILEALNQGYQTGVVPFTEKESVENAGLTWTGDTLNYNPASFVTNFAAIPEPATVALFGLVGGAGLAGYLWRRRRHRQLLDQPMD